MFNHGLRGRRGGDYLTNNNSYNPGLVFGTGNFTVEYWVYMTDIADKGHIQISSTSGGLVASVTGVVYISHGSYSGKWQISVNGAGVSNTIAGTTLNEWHHAALVRNNGTTTFYVDGVSKYSAADTYNYACGYVVVGGYGSTSYLLTGYIKDLRITKGVARYTTAFTPPQAQLKSV